MSFFERIRRTEGNTKATDIGLLIMRVGVGAIMLFTHGWGKLMGFGERAAEFADPFGIGSTLSMGLTVFAEVFCSAAIIIGLFTRAAAVPLLITMLTAAFIIHGDDPWGRKEFPILFALQYLLLIFAGSGRYSLDRLFGGKGKKTAETV